MNGRQFWALRHASDQELEANLGRLLSAGARLEARIVAHLAEVEERRLHLLAGYSSLYDYCRERLALSDYEAFARIAAARTARKYPLVFELLEQRRLHLTAVCEVRDFLTPENHAELLAEVSCRTKLQIREILARRFPRADVPGSLKKLPALEPLSAGRYRLLLTLSTEQKQKLERARDLLSHANPHGEFAIVVERALDELISRLEKRRFGQRETRSTGSETRSRKAQATEPQATEPQATEPQTEDVPRRRRHIRHAVRRQLFAREGARCAFVSAQGHRCEERGLLQFHHQHPWARGGADTTDNLTLLCRAHNRLLAEQEFGKAHVELVISQHAANQSRAEKAARTLTSQGRQRPNAEAADHARTIDARRQQGGTATTNAVTRR